MRVVGIAVLLGIFLVASSALSYRDARRTAGLVAEREGVRLLQRIETVLGRHRAGSDQPEALRAILEANRGLGLTYIALYDLRWARMIVSLRSLSERPTCSKSAVRLSMLGVSTMPSTALIFAKRARSMVIVFGARAVALGERFFI